MGLLARITFLGLLATGLYTCSGNFATELATSKSITYLSDTPDRPQAGTSNPCREQLNYTPDPRHLAHTPMQYVRVNIHFMDKETGMHNFNEAEGVKYAQRVIEGCNQNLANNIPMNLPIGNSTPVLPTRYRLKLTGMPGDTTDDGIYFHEDPELYYYIHGPNTNRNSRTVLREYEIQPDSVINIFLMPHHPDSVGKKGYRSVDTGIMLGGSIKMAQVFSKKPSPSVLFGLTNHEVGHIIGLSHAWRNSDGCDDTPVHSNCYTYGKEPPCDTEVSNNMMDYNQWQHALTPCQIGRAHRQFTNPQARIRKYLEPNWCEPNDIPLIIEDSTHWKSAKDINSDIVVGKDAILMLSCRLSMAIGKRITVAPKGKLILDGAELHNACGDQWYGIEVQSKGKHSGQIIIAGPPDITDCENPLPLESDR